MKNAKKFLFSLLLLAVSGGAFAQAFLEDPKYGNSPEERQQNVLILNYFNDAFGAKNYDLAAQHLQTLLVKAPKATENLYIRGVTIYRTKLAQATSVQERNALVDTLMNIYDIRAEAFGDHASRGLGYIKTQKAAEYATYRPMDRENVFKLYGEAVEATNGQDPEVINTYFSMLVDDYKGDLIETDYLMDEYDRFSGIYEKSQAPDMVEGQKVLESLLLSSGAADCENLEKIYKPKYEANPNDVELMTKIVGMLGRSNCESDFQLLVAENLYKVQPTPETGLALAMIFENKGDYEKSLFYWQESINNEPDPEKKGTYIIRAATSALGANNHRQAVAFAREALAINPNNGLAYMIIGQSYGMAIPSLCSEFERNAAYWLVVDNLQRARGLLSDDAARVEALNSQINQFSRNFPSNEECFFRSLNNGDTYPVNCGWVSGSTTVRVGR